jgi:ubiquinone/menaquinone biosynthesis C-methylase UbiE
MEFLKQFPQQQHLFFLTPEINDFEKAYLQIRNEENRIYSDEIVKKLPQLPKNHPQFKEWKSRQRISQQLLQYLAQNKGEYYLDLGCGNGWFTHQIQKNTKGKVVGLDINALELKQAHRLFANDSCFFAYGDIFKSPLPKQYFNSIILNSCIQYFPDLQLLIKRLLELLKKDGCIHILDSPLYQAKELAAAQQRSKWYYEKKGNLVMLPHYHHHTWEALDHFSYQIAYQPNNFSNKLRRKIMGFGTPFPWIIIKKES